MKRSVFILFLIFPTFCFCQNVFYFDHYWNLCSKDSACYFSQVDPDTIINGEVTYYSLTGSIIHQDYYEGGFVMNTNRYYKNGSRHFVAERDYSGNYYVKKMWNEKGEKVIVNGNGIFSFYYPNGQLWEQGEYKNGVKIGSWKTWYENGQLIEDGYYNEANNYWRLEFGFGFKGDTLVKNGDGHLKIYYPNGNIRFSAVYKFRVANGEYAAYRSNGHFKFALNYRNGVLNGVAKYFYYDGKLRCSGYFLYGRRNGDWIWFDKSGKIIQSIRY